MLIEEEAARAATRSEQTVIELNLESMRAKRAEEKQAREKVGAHYSRLEEDDLEDPGELVRHVNGNGLDSPDILYRFTG